MIALLRSQIPESAFVLVWKDSLPPYEVFLQEAADRLGRQIHHPVEAVEASIKAWGRNRARIDGGIKTSAGEKIFYVELVWLPAYQTFRGEISVRDPLPEIEAKSVDQFIAALEAVSREDRDTMICYQAYEAGLGVDENDPRVERAFPSIFAMFERFPDEYFNSPEVVISLLLERGGFEDLLNVSLARMPSIGAIHLIQGLIYHQQSPPEMKKHWFGVLRELSGCVRASEDVRAYAELVSEGYSGPD